jgi:peptidylprolyl isomerase
LEASVQSGDRVSVHFTARFADGSEVASSRRNGPLEFIAGGSEVIAGLSAAVIGMQNGESKFITVRPAEGFGARDEALVQRVPVADLPNGAKLGESFVARSGDSEMTVWISEIEDGIATLDANHQLAGTTLLFEIELVSFQSS